MKNVTATSIGTNATSSIRQLSTVPFDEGFHFFADNMQYTGITATSLFEFEEKLKIIDAKSVEYHFCRGDFRKWITDIIGDIELSNRISCLDPQYSSETLRTELIEVLWKRIREIDK